jgi:hypothetical protein
MFSNYTLLEVVVLIVGSAGLIWYYVSLFSLGLKPLDVGQTADGFRQFMSLSLTSIAVTLSTFVGMLLGVRTVSNVIKEEAQAASGAAAQAVTPQVQQLASGALTTDIQWWAAAVYVLSILIALYFWYRNGDKTDPAVSNLGKSLLGLVAGALAIALNLPQ